MKEAQKILFITQEDPFYVRAFFDEFLKKYPDKSNILGIVICPTMGKKSTFNLTRQMYGFYGFKDFIRMSSRYLIIKIRGLSLRQLCKSYGIPVYRNEDINSEGFIKYWKDSRPDVIVSVAAPSIFKRTLLNLPKWGCINIHHAKLPNYRGMMPNFWQMYNFEKNAGITVHRMNLKIDEGDILLQREVAIGRDESLDSLIRRSKEIGASCIIETLTLIKEGKVEYLPNHKEEGSYFSFPTKKDVLEFKRRGKKLL